MAMHRKFLLPAAIELPIAALSVHIVSLKLKLSTWHPVKNRSIGALEGRIKSDVRTGDLSEERAAMAAEGDDHAAASVSHAFAIEGQTSGQDPALACSQAVSARA